MRIPRIVLLMLVVSACGRAPERSEDVDSQSSALLDYNVTIPLPADVPASAVALWANSRLDVADRATLSGATGCGFALVNEGALETNLGVESRTPSTWSHAPILVEIGHRPARFAVRARSASETMSLFPGRSFRIHRSRRHRLSAGR